MKKMRRYEFLKDRLGISRREFPATGWVGQTQFAGGFDSGGGSIRDWVPMAGAKLA